MTEIALAAVPHPARATMRTLRPLCQQVVRRRWDLHLHGVEHVPTQGPVILAPNHIGLIDGPLLAICSPRPVHALTKQEMFAGKTGRFLRAAGQIPLDRFRTDPGAVKTCLRVLADDGAVGIFPEGTRGAGDFTRLHRGAAYLGLVSGAPIVPVVFLGTREPGGDNGSVPPRGGRIDVVYGEPIQLERTAWPRTREHVGRSTALLGERLTAHLNDARALTGRDLPGPLPAGQREDDPDTGVVDQGA